MNQDQDPERQFVCERVLEWVELKKDQPGDGEDRLHRCHSRVYSCGLDKHGEPDVKFYDVPPDLKIIPMRDKVALLLVGKFILDSQYMFFRLAETESSKRLEDLFVSGHVGLVTGGTMDIFSKYKLIVLRWHPKIRMFVGFAPNDQDECIKRVRQILYDMTKIKLSDRLTPEERKVFSAAQKALEKTRAECMTEVMKLSKAKAQADKEEAQRKAQAEGQGKDQPKGHPKDQPKVSPKVQAKSQTRVQSRVQNKAQLTQRKSQVKAQAETTAKEHAESKARAKTQEEEGPSQLEAGVQPESLVEAEMHEYPQAAQGHFQAQMQEYPQAAQGHSQAPMHEYPQPAQGHFQAQMQEYPQAAQGHSQAPMHEYPQPVQGHSQAQMLEYPQPAQGNSQAQMLEYPQPAQGNSQAPMHEYPQPAQGNSQAQMLEYPQPAQGHSQVQMHEYPQPEQEHFHAQVEGNTHAYGQMDQAPAHMQEHPQASQGHFQAQVQPNAHDYGQMDEALAQIHEYANSAQGYFQAQVEPYVYDYGQMPQAPTLREEYVHMEVEPPAHAQLEDSSNMEAYPQGQVQFQMQEYAPQINQTEADEFALIESLFDAQKRGAPVEEYAQGDQTQGHRQDYAELLTFVRAPWEGQIQENSNMGQAHTQELGQTEVPAQTREQAQAQEQLKAQETLQAYAQAHAAAAARVIACLQKLEEATAQLQAVQGYEGQQPFEEAQRSMLKCRQELAEAQGIAVQYAQAFVLAQEQAQAQMQEHQPWQGLAQIQEFQQVEGIVRAQAQPQTEGQAQANLQFQHQGPFSFNHWEADGS